MTELNTSINSNQDDSEDSDDNLKIVLESPIRKLVEENNLTDFERRIIEPFEEKLEESLEEKASRANLNAINVKTILRKVATNEHVVALIREAEETIEKDTYEPKLTRSKAKELSTNPIPSVPWITPTKNKSEVEVLLRDDLQEDSSGDEYVPCEEESEDDKESTVISDYDPPSVPDSLPPTPTKNIDSSTQTNWTEDGLFKIPETVNESLQKTDEKANIALRTRSKLSLSSTPLEVIEEAFIPPDITTDMYDMDCDDDEWKDFLKKFTRPLDEVTKEEDDQDPEYNAEEVEEVDIEELRMDRGVKVTKKELNDLIAELFEFTDNYEMENRKKSVQMAADESVVQTESLLEDSNGNIQPVEEEIIIEAEQFPLLEQQLRQHVQILTQNFLLTYQHPELHENSIQFKEYLLNLKFLGSGKQKSSFFITTLNDALDLVSFWENWFAENSKEVEEYKDFVRRDFVECKQRFTSGAKHIPKFPPFLMKTIADSTVFLYPDLLPRIPYQPISNGVRKRTRDFILPETNLIALGLEQFTPIAREYRLNITRKGTVNLLAISQYIQDYMMPHFAATQIYERIKRSTRPGLPENPINYFFKHGKVMDYVHYVFPLDILKILPPRKRKLEELPTQWAEYIYPQPICPPPTYQVILIENYQPGTGQFILPNSLVLPPLKPIKVQPPRRQTRQQQLTTTNTKQTKEKIYTFNELKRFIECLSKPLSSDRIFACGYLNNTDKNCDNLDLNMLPSMPCLASNFHSSPHPQSTDDPQLDNDLIPESESEINCNLDIPDGNEDDCFGSMSEQNENDKDNPDDINALMVASANLKAVRTKPSGAEKKRAKIRREFISNLLISTPDDPAVEKEKSENFALAYYDKMREVLKLDDYHKMMQVLNEHEGDAIELYRKIEPILKDDYQQLCEEFLLFLREKEAAAIGKLIPWIQMNVRSKFLRKLETYFKNQPIQLRRIYKTITELSQMSDVSLDKIKSSLIPMLKGNSTLIDLLVQNFMCESPPASLLEGPYETIDLHKEMSRPDEEEIYETITIPEIEDKYGGMNCTCTCHEIEDHEFKSRYRHCIPCGTRFMQGKVYIQSGRGLRPATISFPTSPNVDHNVRLNGKPSSQRKKRSETSPSKQGVALSLMKECIDEETDDDVDGKNKTKRKTPHKRKKQPDKQMKINKDSQKKISSKKLLNCDVLKTDDNCQNVKLSAKRATRKSRLKTKEDGGGSSSERDTKEVDGMDWEASASTESADMKTGSPEHNTAESESEFCEESSQDNCGSDTNSSVSSSNAHSQSDINDDICWKREEDKIILETFKQENEKEEAFKIIAHQLKNRTVSQIRNRFQMLLNLIMEQIAERK